MTAAQLVSNWYKAHRGNEVHPFTIPEPSLRALVAAVQERTAYTEELEDEVETLHKRLSEMEAEGLAPPDHEEEG